MDWSSLLACFQVGKCGLHYWLNMQLVETVGSHSHIERIIVFFFGWQAVNLFWTRRSKASMLWNKFLEVKPLSDCSLWYKLKMTYWHVHWVFYSHFLLSLVLYKIRFNSISHKQKFLWMVLSVWRYFCKQSIYVPSLNNFVVGLLVVGGKNLQLACLKVENPKIEEQYRNLISLMLRMYYF